MRAFALLVAVLAVAVVGVSADAWTAIDPSYSVNSIVPSLTAAPITFTPSGDLILVDSRFSPPCLFRFPNAVSTPFGATIPFAYASTCELSGGHSVLGASGSDIVVTAAGRLYQSTGQELSLSNYTVARVAFSNCGAAHGIALDPTDGSLFISNYGTRRVYKVPNPDTHPGTQILDCNAPFFDAGAQINSGIDGLTVGPDGTLYMAAYDIASLAVVSSAGQLIGVKGTGQAAGFGPDGISICIGDGNSFAMTSTANRGQIIKFNLTGPGGAPTYGTSTVATNGATGYLDWTVVDPKGCIWGTTMNGPNGVYRISNADGSCPNCNAPQVPPSTSCPNCSDAVHVAFSASEAVITATANSAGSCVSLVFDS